MNCFPSRVPIVVLYALFIMGCASTQTSSGCLIGSNVRGWPEGIPKKVGVSVFSWDFPSTIQSTDQFSAGLITLGFEVVERQHFDKIISELNLQETGLITERTRKELGEQIGLEGVFVGSILGEVSPVSIDTHLTIKLVDVLTGRIIWSVTTRDPRVIAWSADVRSSVVHTTNQALKMLEQDLHNIK